MRMPDEPKAKNRTADRKACAADICLSVLEVSRRATSLRAASTLPGECFDDEAPDPNDAASTHHGNTLQGSVSP